MGVIVARQALTLKEEEHNLYLKPRTLSMQYMIGMRVNNDIKCVSVSTQGG